MKLTLQFTLAVLSLIPLVLGASGLIWGTALYLPVDQIVPALDNQFRYWAGFYLLLAFLLWWAIPNIERHTVLVRLICLALVIGGLGRLLSILTVGPGDTLQWLAMALEIGSVVLLPWHAAVRKHSNA
jgi:hypothetical protein